MRRYMRLRGDEWQELAYTGSCAEGTVHDGGQTVDVDAAARRSEWSLRLGERVLRVEHLGGIRYRVNGREFDSRLQTELEHRFSRFQNEADDEAVKRLEAPMPGRIVQLMVKEGDLVARGQGLLIVEAMKMENELKAPASAEIGRITVEVGQGVEKGTVLIEFV